MHAMAIAQAAKVDRKLYIGNLPTGITPSTVRKNTIIKIIFIK